MIPITTVASVQDDRRRFDEFMQWMAQLAKYKAIVGLLAEAGAASKTYRPRKTPATPKEGEVKAEPEPMTLIEVAIANEFGTDTIPERSFLRGWVDENQERIVAFIASFAEPIVEGKLTPQQAMHQIGLWAQGQIQERIAARIPPPNSAVTVANKGSDVPLIDTGQLRASISYKVTDQNEQLVDATGSPPVVKPRVTKAQRKYAKFVKGVNRRSEKVKKRQDREAKKKQRADLKEARRLTREILKHDRAKK